jgi:hypothetical protein
MANKETLSTRVARMEEAQIRMQNAMAHLAEVQAQNQTEDRERDKHIAELRQEALERERRVDDRIEKLVIAIGELVSRMPPPAMTT